MFIVSLPYLVVLLDDGDQVLVEDASPLQETRGGQKGTSFILVCGRQTERKELDLQFNMDHNGEFVDSGLKFGCFYPFTA